MFKDINHKSIYKLNVWFVLCELYILFLKMVIESKSGLHGNCSLQSNRILWEFLVWSKRKTLQRNVHLLSIKTELPSYCDQRVCVSMLSPCWQCTVYLGIYLVCKCGSSSKMNDNLVFVSNILLFLCITIECSFHI